MKLKIERIFKNTYRSQIFIIILCSSISTNIRATSFLNSPLYGRRTVCTAFFRISSTFHRVFNLTKNSFHIRYRICTIEGDCLSICIGYSCSRSSTCCTTGTICTGRNIFTGCIRTTGRTGFFIFCSTISPLKLIRPRSRENFLMSTPTK